MERLARVGGWRKPAVGGRREPTEFGSAAQAAALIGGFALGNLGKFVSNSSGEWLAVEWIGLVVYLLSFIAVHSCTCSCLTSAMFYRACNRVTDEEGAAWAARYSLMLKMPVTAMRLESPWPCTPACPEIHSLLGPLFGSG